MYLCVIQYIIRVFTPFRGVEQMLINVLEIPGGKQA